MLRWGLPVVAALVLAAGCGGSTASSAGADLSVVPAGAVVHATVSSDLDSDQWNRIESLLARFPAGGKLVERLRAALAEEGVDFDRDVAPALGPTVELVALGPEDDGVVFLTQPDDVEALRDALAKADEPPVVVEVEDWVAIAQDETAVDRYRTALAQGTLEGDERYAEAMADLPGDALGRVFVDAAALTDALPQAEAVGAQVETLGAALVARDDGIALEARTRLAEGAELPQPGALVERVPESAFAFLAFGGGGSSALDLGGQLSQAPQLRQALEALEAQLGVDPEALAALLGGGGVLYLAPGALIPELTLVLEPDDPAQAVETLDRLARGLGQAPQRRELEGVDARVVQLGGLVSLHYGAADGRLVVSTAPTAFAGPSGGSIADDGRFEDALEAAGVEEGEQVSLYLDMDEVLRLADQAAGLAGNAGGLPAEVRENLEHLSTLVVASGVDGRTATGRVFLGVD